MNVPVLFRGGLARDEAGDESGEDAFYFLHQGKCAIITSLERKLERGQLEMFVSSAGN